MAKDWSVPSYDRSVTIICLNTEPQWPKWRVGSQWMQLQLPDLITYSISSFHENCWDLQVKHEHSYCIESRATFHWNKRTGLNTCMLKRQSWNSILIYWIISWYFVFLRSAAYVSTPIEIILTLGLIFINLTSTVLWPSIVSQGHQVWTSPLRYNFLCSQTMLEMLC